MAFRSRRPSLSQYGADATYLTPQVQITEIVRSLDARGINFAAPGPSAPPVDGELAARVASLERQVNRRGTSRLNLVAFSRDVRDAYGRPLRPPPPSSSHDLKKVYVSQVLTAAEQYAAKFPELRTDFTDHDTYELYRLLDAPASSDYDAGPLHVHVAESNGPSTPQYRPGFPGPRDSRGSWSRGTSRDRSHSGNHFTRPPSRPPSPGGSRHPPPSATASSSTAAPPSNPSSLKHSAVRDHTYTCVVVTPPFADLPPSAFAQLQRLSAVPPTLVRSCAPTWRRLAEPSQSSLAWLLDGSLAASPVDWDSFDPTLPPFSVIPAGSVPLGPAYSELLVFTTRESSL
ncbi:hypothetical protein HDU96_000907, partial [Phlyctochytrium bullatum]